MSEPYRTLETPATIEFVVRGSTFIAHARPVDTVERAEAFLERVRDEYDDATHNVPAYRVRTDDAGVREYESDADEPTGSAGKPALNVLQQRDLENCVVVVTRYYGGTNLGIGGLVRAYSRAVTSVVEEAGVIETRPHRRLEIVTEYDDSGTVRGILESEALAFEADYQESVTFDVRVPTTAHDALCDRLRSATSGRVELE